MHSKRYTFALGFATLVLAMPQSIVAQEVDFGDDASRYANDGECDDNRFSGIGMTGTVLLDDDVGHDATDCSAAYESGSIVLRGSATRLAIGKIDWGNDSGEWANDSECDDVRFVGNAMARSLLTDGIGKDASDCKAAYAIETVGLDPLFAEPTDDRPVHFGDDSSDYANDGQCDDIRFTGDYASEMIYLADDIGHDATDCKTAFEAGTARWQANDLPINFGEMPPLPSAES